jgi:hypothetical protein
LPLQEARNKLNEIGNKSLLFKYEKGACSVKKAKLLAVCAIDSFEPFAIDDKPRFGAYKNILENPVTADKLLLFKTTYNSAFIEIQSSK